MKKAHGVSISDIGPIHRLDIPIPEGGGIVVLRGRNGSGKTTGLDAMKALVSGQGKLEVRRGALKGLVEGLGGTIKIRKVNRREGTIEVTSLEGVDPSTLVDPGIADPAAADKRRIEALCLLAGTAAGEDDFDELIEASGLVPEGASLSIDWEDATSLPARAGILKRVFEEAARKSEQDERGEVVAAIVLESSLEGVLEGVTAADQGELEDERDALLQAITEAQTIRREGKKTEETVSEARRQLETIAENAMSVERATELAEEANERLITSTAVHKAAAGALVRAENDKEEARRLLDVANIQMTGAEDFDEARSALRKVVERSEELTFPTIAEIEDLEEQLEEKRIGVQVATLSIERSPDRKALKNHRLEAEIFKAEARLLRDAAHSVSEVLNAAIQDVLPENLIIEDGRLIRRDRGGEKVYFSDLSTGERYRIAIPIGMKAVGDGGLLTIDQGAYEGLDPKNRLEVKEIAEDLGVVIVTAVADDGELRAEVA